MEIDLNHAAGEVEKNAHQGNEEFGDKNDSSSSSSNSASSSFPASASIYMELWRACAGPLTSLPKKGNFVVYFPQGHLEQVASSSPFTPTEMLTFELPPQILCKVVNVKLLANRENDEVYTQLSLLPQLEVVGTKLEEKELQELGMEEDGDGLSPTKSTHMFCKTLTASDTSTHGGFSVPRRAAEDCFPPLDYKQQRPSQELVAKDLHGVEWKFRHIYRGQPRRHLLTTGWSIFVSQKNLVSGDAVLFLRGKNGDLRLGVRRAVRPRNGIPESVIGNHRSHPSILSSVANAVSTKSMFHVFYSPRASQAEVVIPYQKYMKSITNPIPVGTRFKMRFEMDDSPERRCSGMVTGRGDLDPYRWPNSKWRCLIVRWDEDIMNDHRERVSPWEIDPSVCLSPLSIQSSPRLKKMRTSLQPSPPDLPNIGRGGFLDFEGSVGSSKVLQGQENVGLLSPVYTGDKVNPPLDFKMQYPANQNFQSTTAFNKGNNIREFMRDPQTKYPGSVESDRFPKVLQGQEICQLRSLPGGSVFTSGAWQKPDYDCNSFSAYQRQRPNFYPLASQGARNMFFPCNDIFKTIQDPVGLPCAPNLSQEKARLPLSSALNGLVRREARTPAPNQMVGENSSAVPSIEGRLKSQEDPSLRRDMTDCKLFGISLAGAVPAHSSQIANKRSCTKVHKQGSLVGRAIDLSRLNGYTDLLFELERLFGMEGLLHDHEKGWQILYTDSENDMMVVGDDPWNEFCDVVSKIHIYTKEEVEKLSMGLISEDTHSCLEEAPPGTDMSKSSSVGQPDSYPTIIRV